MKYGVAIDLHISESFQAASGAGGSLPPQQQHEKPSTVAEIQLMNYLLHHNAPLARLPLVLRQLIATGGKRKLKSSLPVPSIELQVIGNGSTSLGACFILKGPTRFYVFNCPEGIRRYMSIAGLNAATVCDIFITRNNWDNVAGLSGLLLRRDLTKLVEGVRDHPVHLHGAKNLKSYLESIRPFLDTDFGKAKYPVSVVEVPDNTVDYESTLVRVKHIPLGDNGPSSSGCGEQITNTAYLVELKPPYLHLDIEKLIELEVPRGELTEALKRGRTILIPNTRRLVRPEEVVDSHFCVVDQVKKSSLLVVDIETDGQLKLITRSEDMQGSLRKGKQLDYLAHFTRQEMVATPAYRKWMEAFGEGCTHLMLNGSGPAFSAADNFCNMQDMMHAIAPRIFPSLHLSSIGKTEQGSKPASFKPNGVAPARYQRPLLRGDSNAPCAMSPEPTLLNVERPESRRAIARFRKQVATSLLREEITSTSDDDDDQYPVVYFLGTGSGDPTPHRNVSSYLLQLALNSYVMVDCGDGTYNQIRILFPPDEGDRILINLKALFITHAHQDHMNGMFTLIIQRRDAFIRQNKPYIPLIITLDANVRKNFWFFCENFESLVNWVFLTDVSLFTTPQRELFGGHEEVRLFGGQQAFRHLKKQFPPPLFSRDEWNLRNVQAVHVDHTKLACGYVFVEHKRGRKIVFSGDTRPCDILVEQGKGADLLIHEATFGDNLKEDAIKKSHSTTAEAVDIARRMQAKHVILTHFSSLYKETPELPDHLLEAGNISVARDFMVARFNELAFLPKLLPLYREIFSSELEEVKKMGW